MSRRSPTPPLFTMLDPNLRLGHALAELDRSATLGSVDELLSNEGIQYYIGIDEAGRGPWAGPVVAAAILIQVGPLPSALSGLDDSKRLNQKQRAQLFRTIPSTVVAHGIAQVEPSVIDEINILQATLRAMKLACDRTLNQVARHGLPVPKVALVDGNARVPSLSIDQHCVVKGDARSIAIAAASIIAKEVRDHRMRALDIRYPHYGFAQHKGYGTAAHQAALLQHGVCPIHRKSYRPIKALL